MSPSDGARGWQGPPRTILSARPFLGVSGGSKEDDLDCLVRFSKPAASAHLLNAAADCGIGAFAPLNDPVLLQALALARVASRLEVYPVIPNVMGYVRAATDHGMVGAGLRVLRNLGVADLFGIGLRGLAVLRGVLSRDFRTILSLLIDVEMAAFRKFRPPVVLLHSQITDIAVALGNHEALGVFADVVRKRFGAEPGVVTNNFVSLMQVLTQWGLDIRIVVAPFNASGFLMKPTPPACESLLRTTDRFIVADRIAPGGTATLPQALEYLQRLGIRSAVVDVADTVTVNTVSRLTHGTPRA
ncbi:hypothetical protein L6Q96_16745 [Candidatus Binatia bacterium]|nr:hypothetical protein [Candidatus Binatia bacterium]